MFQLIYVICKFKMISIERKNCPCSNWLFFFSFALKIIAVITWYTLSQQWWKFLDLIIDINLFFCLSQRCVSVECFSSCDYDQLEVLPCDKYMSWLVPWNLTQIPSFKFSSGTIWISPSQDFSISLWTTVPPLARNEPILLNANLVIFLFSRWGPG